MIVPGLSRASQALALNTLERLAGSAVAVAFMDADRLGISIVDPTGAVRAAAYRAAAYGVRSADAMQTATTEGAAATLAEVHGLSPVVSGALIGAAVGLRLGLRVRLSRSRVPKRRRPKLAVRVAPFTKAQDNLAAAKR